MTKKNPPPPKHRFLTVLLIALIFALGMIYPLIYKSLRTPEGTTGKNEAPALTAGEEPPPSPEDSQRSVLTAGAKRESFPPSLMLSVLLRGLAAVLLLWGILYAAGSLVHYQNIKVNYTRKIGHFSLFFLPPCLTALFPLQTPGLGENISWIGMLLSLVVLAKPIRRRFPLARRMFLAMDRPEDRPYTLLWFWVQILAGVGVLMGSGAVLRHFDYGETLILVPILAAVGDGLAEPVGVSLGKHRYKAYALFTRKTYYRTLEGSLTVYAATLGILLFSRGYFTPREFIAALVLVPVVITLSEAAAPHTMDTPFLHFFGYASLFTVKHFF